jgi:hypothetical protein
MSVATPVVDREVADAAIGGGGAHENTAESYFALLKRGLIG